MANLVVSFHPDRNNRILLCAHYDTRPFPDRDPRRPRGRFIGANDGGSGVAVLMELAHHVGKLDSPYGVDFVLFDGEEFVFEERQGTYFLGSEHFARQYVAEPPAYRYRAAVLLDMVGDAQLQLFQERNSVSWADSRPLVDEIWGTAKKMGITEFIARPKHEIRDDHLALHDIARIPACDIIDFDYPRSSSASYWHTEADTPDKCSGDSLAKVAAVLLEWLRTNALDGQRYCVTVEHWSGRASRQSQVAVTCARVRATTAARHARHPHGAAMFGQEAGSLSCAPRGATLSGGTMSMASKSPLSGCTLSHAPWCVTLEDSPMPDAAKAPERPQTPAPGNVGSTS